MKHYQFYFPYGAGTPDIREAPAGAADTFTGKDIMDRMAHNVALFQMITKLAAAAVEADDRGELPDEIGALLYERMEDIREVRRQVSYSELLDLQKATKEANKCKS